MESDQNILADITEMIIELFTWDAGTCQIIRIDEKDSTLFMIRVPLEQ